MGMCMTDTDSVKEAQFLDEYSQYLDYCEQWQEAGVKALWWGDNWRQHWKEMKEDEAKTAEAEAAATVPSKD